jgi:hypothetical protein
MQMACEDEVIYQERSMSLDLSECISTLSIKAQTNLCTKSAFEGKDRLNGCLWLKSENELFVLSASLDQSENIKLNQPEILSNVDISNQNFNVAMAFYEDQVDCLNINTNDFCGQDQSCVFSQSFKSLEKDLENKISSLKECHWTYHTLKADQTELFCDDLDNDCDGKIDEGQSFKIGDACENGLKGVCLQSGTYQCSTIGMAPTCQLALDVQPSVEICNSLDDDCDGQIDNLSLFEDCEIGKDDCLSRGKKICQNGELICDAISKKLDIEDICDGIDNDCDESVDENFVEEIISCGVGACASEILSSCQNGILNQTCTPLLAINTLDEGCDGIDDDCDGQLDENFLNTSSCGQGVCRMDGISICQHNEGIAQINSRCEPSQAISDLDVICNGLDDDCDGAVDEDYMIMAIQCGQGICRSEGEIRCVYGNEINTCMPTPVAIDVVDHCDGLDNDCDGRSDEAHQNDLSNCSVGLCQSLGFVACQNGQIQDTCMRPIPLNLTDSCDGLDNDCDGNIDENFVSVATNCGLGVCYAESQTACIEGIIVDLCEERLQSGVSETICNGLDDNCNGLIDEGFEDVIVNCDLTSCGTSGIVTCLNGEEKNTCRVGTPASNDPNCDGVDDDCDGNIDEDYRTTMVTCGQGVCQRSGNRSCIQGREVNICTPAMPMIGEIDQNCNLTDDDCDSRIDEGYQASSIRCGLGICSKLGLRTCENGIVSDQCQPNLPNPNDTDDNCNLVDDDCDGKTDESYMSQTISCGVGACQANGITVCVNGSVQNYCNPNPSATNDSTCNLIDDDCDGRTDESYVETSIECGVGDCKNTGTRVCSNGVEINRCEPLAIASGANDSDCDSRDDDCDGKTDESYMSTSVSCGMSSCQNQGSLICIQGSITNTCAPNNPNILDNQCDGIDNNCNGQTDEGYQPTASTCGQGVCANTGPLNCISGQLVNACVPKLPSSATEICNNLDDNCNGSTDENISRPTTCGRGICANNGIITCNNGIEVTNCTPLSPSTEQCGDGLDNDCDGNVDEGFANLGMSCMNGVGACQRTGTFVCASNRLSTVCNAVPAQAGIETCNNIDDDCDMVVDDGLDNLGSCDVPGLFGACLKGISKCQNGAIACTQTVFPSTEIYCPANSIDENCNGLIDEVDYQGVVVQLYKIGEGSCNKQNQCYSCGVFNQAQQTWTIDNCQRTNCY